MAMRKNLLGLVPKLTPQETNEVIFFLKRFNYEKYQRLCYDVLLDPPLMLSPLDEVKTAVGLWGTASPSLLSKLKSAG
jgi:hypothetical protein